MKGSVNNYEQERLRLEKIQKAKFDMYSQKREVVKKMNQDLEKDVLRKELTLEEQLREKATKRESIR